VTSKKDGRVLLNGVSGLVCGGLCAVMVSSAYQAPPGSPDAMQPDAATMQVAHSIYTAHVDLWGTPALAVSK